ncbi:MAG: DUF4861 family protein [Bacteroidaceae bacterium]|nr:DUF4861 family protein [Bacteroidaceae bacterium]
MKLILTSILMTAILGVNAQTLRKEITIDSSHGGGPVVLRLSDIKGLDFDVKSATIHVGFFTPPKETRGADGSVTISYRDEDLMLSGQLDDLDGDERADELVFVPSGKEYTVDFYADNKGVTKFGVPTFGDKRFVYADMMLDDKKAAHPLITALEAPGDSYLYNDLYHHGAAFENAWCGFRVYFDARQNIDIYGKQHPRLELADTHFYTTAEQMKQGYGNDVLWAGNSVGCGSFKGWDGKAPTNIEPVKIRGQRIVASGPIRTIVEVKDIGWNGLNMRQYYTLYAGCRECEVRITFDRPLGDEVFCTGVQKIGASPEGFVHADGLAASWGSDYPEMGNKEQFPPEAVGLAVYVPKQYIHAVTESDLNYLILLSAKGQTELKYYVVFCADKELPDDRLASQRFSHLDVPAGYHSARAWFDALPDWQTYINYKLNGPKVKIK